MLELHRSVDHPYGSDGPKEGPFKVNIRDQATDAILETWADTAARPDGSFPWRCDMPPGATIIYEFIDGKNQVAKGYPRTVEGSKDVSCLGKNSGLTDAFHSMFDARIKALQDAAVTTTAKPPPPPKPTTTYA
jgi:hypothetical protein